MKKLLSYICWVLAIFCLMGCGSDGGAEMIPELPAAERVSVKLQLAFLKAGRLPERDIVIALILRENG